MFDLNFDHRKKLEPATEAACRFPSKPEEAFGVFCRFCGKGFQGQIANFGDCGGGFPHKGGFATFPAIGNRREVGRIGFHHDSVNRKRGCGLAQVPGVFESDNPGEGDVMAKFNRFLRLLQGSIETMKHAAKVG